MLLACNGIATRQLFLLVPGTQSDESIVIKISLTSDLKFNLIKMITCFSSIRRTEVPLYYSDYVTIVNSVLFAFIARNKTNRRCLKISYIRIRFFAGPSTPTIATIKHETVNPTNLSIEIGTTHESITAYRVQLTGNTAEDVSFSACVGLNTSCTFNHSNQSNTVVIGNLMSGTFYTISFFTLYREMESMAPQTLTTYTSKLICFYLCNMFLIT